MVLHQTAWILNVDIFRHQQFGARKRLENTPQVPYHKTHHPRKTTFTLHYDQAFSQQNAPLFSQHRKRGPAPNDEYCT